MRCWLRRTLASRRASYERPEKTQRRHCAPCTDQTSALPFDTCIGILAVLVVADMATASTAALEAARTVSWACGGVLETV